MSDDGHSALQKTPSDTDSNSNSGSLFSRRYPDDLSLDSSGSKENSPSLSNNENSSSPKLLSHRTGTALTVRRRLLKDFFVEGFKCQPKMTHEDFIDLSTNEEKSNSDDEWFMRKIKASSGTHFIDRGEKSGNSRTSLGTTRTDVQKFLRNRLAELRRVGQEKRKALYDADNGIVSGGQDVCGLNGEEIKASEWDSDEKPQTISAAENKEDEMSRCDLLEREADESCSGDDEIAGQENETNDRKIKTEDKSNEEVNGRILKEIENIELSKESKDINEANQNKFFAKSAEDTFNADWESDWLQSRTKTCGSLAERKNDARFYPTSSETESPDMSDETAEGSEEDDRNSSLVDELLDDVAANCSDGSGSEDRDSGDEELIRRNKKPRKRRLLFSPSNSDEDEKDECRNLEVDNGENIGNCSVNKKQNSSCDVTAVLSKSDIFEVNDRERILFGGDGSDHDRDIIHSIYDPSDEEDQRVDELEETASSDDELKVFHKLQIAQKQKKRFEYIEEEASLSGDDVGSDENDDEDQLNVYEAEEGDNDELPDDETIREQLHKQWLKQQQEEEDRKLLYWKDLLLVEGDSTDRTFRFKLRQTKSEKPDNEIDKLTVDTEDIEVNDSEMWKRRREMSKWKINNHKVELPAENTSLDGTNLLLKAASNVIDKGSLDGNSQPHEKAEATLCKNSLLNHRKSLSQVLHQTKITLYTKSTCPISAQRNET